jgi:hypothetical protein
MSDDSEIAGLWESRSGPVLWVRPWRGRSVQVSLAPMGAAPALELALGRGDTTTVIAVWDDYNGELRIPLPRLPHGAELILAWDNHSSVAEGGPDEPWLTGGVSRRDEPGALYPLPAWLLPRAPFRRVPRESWPRYAMVSAGSDEVPARPEKSPAGRRTRECT